MLCMNSYSQDYIDECRARVDLQLASYQNLLISANQQSVSDDLAPAIIDFEPVFFNNMVLLLDNLFCHRSRTMELKDGNPLNEVRVICNSLLNHNSVMEADKGIKLDPKKSVLQYHIGDRIALTQTDFVRLSNAFFAEIESKYLELPEAVSN